MWNRDAEDRKSHRAEIGGTVRIGACDEAERKRDRDRDDESRQRKFERSRETLHDEMRDRLVHRDRFAEVAFREAAEKCRVLLPQRTIEAQLMPHALDIRRRGHIAEHCDYRIAGDEVYQREGDRRDAERDRNQREQAASEISDQGPITQMASRASDRRSRAGFHSDRV